MYISRPSLTSKRTFNCGAIPSLLELKTIRKITKTGANVTCVKNSNPSPSTKPANLPTPLIRMIRRKDRGLRMV